MMVIMVIIIIKMEPIDYIIMEGIILIFGEYLMELAKFKIP